MPCAITESELGETTLLAVFSWSKHNRFKEGITEIALIFFMNSTSLFYSYALATVKLMGFATGNSEEEKNTTDLSGNIS